MKVTVVTCLFAKWDMNVDAGHELRFMIDDLQFWFYESKELFHKGTKKLI